MKRTKRTDSTKPKTPTQILVHHQVEIGFRGLQTTTSTPIAYPKYLLELEKMLGSTVAVAMGAAEVFVALRVEVPKDEEAGAEGEDPRVVVRLALADVCCALALLVVAIAVDAVAEARGEDWIIDAEAV